MKGDSDRYCPTSSLEGSIFGVSGTSIQPVPYRKDVVSVFGIGWSHHYKLKMYCTAVYRANLCTVLVNSKWFYSINKSVELRALVLKTPKCSRIVETCASHGAKRELFNYSGQDFQAGNIVSYLCSEVMLFWCLYSTFRASFDRQRLQPGYIPSIQVWRRPEGSWTWKSFWKHWRLDWKDRKWGEKVERCCYPGDQDKKT